MGTVTAVAVGLAFAFTGGLLTGWLIGTRDQLGGRRRPWPKVTRRMRAEVRKLHKPLDKT